MVNLGPIRDLTEAQTRVCGGIDRGLSYREIAAELGVSENTVKAHIRAVANLIDEPSEFPPRTRILLWIRESQKS